MVCYIYGWYIMINFPAIDCVSDRKAAMDEFKLGTQGIFVPECTPDGRYKKVQCFRSTGKYDGAFSRLNELYTFLKNYSGATVGIF